MHQPSVQRWLQDHCESSGLVSGGLVIAAQDDASGASAASQPATQTIAEWPASGSMTGQLAAAASAALQRARPVMVAPKSAPEASIHNRVISLPLRSHDRSLGAVALAVRAENNSDLNALFKDLERASSQVCERLGDSPAPSTASDAAQVLQLQNTLQRHTPLADGALALCGELAAAMGCERVSLGVIEAGEMNIVAVSNSAEFKREHDLARLMVGAMQEAAEQGASVRYPTAGSGAARIVLAHAELHARCGHALASVALVHGQSAIGALLAEWRGTEDLSEARLALLDSLACAIGPLVALSHRCERPWHANPADAWRAAWGRITRRNDPSAKLLAVAALTGVAAALWLPVDYRVGAPARIEGAVQRVVAAPMDGYLKTSHVRPGDTVKAGDVLVELADQDLLLEQRKWEGTLNQQENGFAAALARADRAQFVIAQGKAGEARAQLDLVRQQLGRTRLLAPIDGVVIKGDLSQALGAPVQRGDALLTLAPAEHYRLIVDVDERDVAQIQPGQTGQLALASLPAETLAFVVERVTPVANARDGRNAFEVEARLRGAAPPLRPGLLGVAKIDAGQRSAAWIWGHRGLDWLRLAWWTWGP